MNQSNLINRQTITDETYIYLNFEKSAPGGGGGEEQRLAKEGEYIKPSTCYVTDGHVAIKYFLNVIRNRK